MTAAGRSAILTYHSLDDSGSVVSTPPALFSKQMEFLASSGIRVVPLERIRESAGCVAITFDDGYCSVMQHGLPELERHGMPATIFAITRYCGRECDWPGQPPEIPRLPLMSWGDLARLPPRITVGAHTATHSDLSVLTEAGCQAEMLVCQQELEQRLGRAVRTFAYPYGSVSREARMAASRHFDLAVGTSLRFIAGEEDAMEMPRIDSYYLRGGFSLERLFTVRGEAYIRGRSLLRKARQAALHWN